MLLVRVSQTFIPEKLQPLIALTLQVTIAPNAHSSSSQSVKTPRHTPVTTEFHTISSMPPYIVMKFSSCSGSITTQWNLTHPLIYMCSFMGTRTSKPVMSKDAWMPVRGVQLSSFGFLTHVSDHGMHDITRQFLVQGIN